MQKNQKGFTPIHVIFLLLALSLVGLVGWYVWHVHEHDKKKVTVTAAKITTYAECAKASGVIQESYPEVCVKDGQRFTNPDQKVSATPPDPTADWQTVTTPDKHVSFKMPKSWVSIDCSDSGGSDKILYIASSSNLLAKCQSDYSGEASVNYDNNAPNPAWPPAQQAGETTYSKESLKINGLTGYKITTITDGSVPYSGDAGTKSVQYWVSGPNNNYYAYYTQTPTSKDDLETFDLITNSIRF